jgi:acetyl esterase/lipase
MNRREFLHTPALLAGTALEDFPARQERRRRELWKLLGDLPDPRPPQAKVVKTEKHEGFALEHLELDLNGVEPVPALLLIPDKRPARAPGLLYIHAHGGKYDLGKEELVQGRPVLQAYAPVLAAKGIVTLAIDSWCFSGRKRLPDGRQGELDTFKHMLWKGQTLWGMMMFDEVQALTYLRGRAEVDPDRLGAFGLSMGSTKSWWLAALDTRVKVCIDLCCLTDYDELIRIGNIKGHGIYYFVPSQLKHFASHEVNELIVPRLRLSLNGRKDLLTPPAGVERIRDHVRPLYARHGRAEDCRIELFDCGHEETPEMRKLVLEWLDKI